MKHIQIAAIIIAALLALATGAAAPGSGPAPALAAPANDDFANAITVTTPAVSGIVASGSTVGAGSQFLEPDTFPANSCFFGSPGWTYGNSVWFNWTSPATPGSIRIDTWGSDFNTSIVVFTGNTVSSLAGVPGGCSQGFLTNSANPALVQLTYAANTLYRIQVSGVSYATGNFVLSLVSGSEIVVNSTADNTTSDGNMTLREAMHVATGTLGRALSGGEAGVVVGTAGAGSDAVRFNDNLFPPGAPATITVTQALPSTFLNSNKTISGIGTGVIVDGNNLNIECIRLEGNNNHIEGIQVRRCATGVLVGGANNVFGGTLPIQRNVVRENTVGWGYGVQLGLASSQVIGNFIGTDATGTAAAGNSIGVVGGNSGTISGNVISGNATGVSLGGFFNTLVGNKIGTRADGTGDLGNSGNGVELYNYGQAIAGNIIAGNNGHGIRIDQASDDVIKGNYIGLDANGGGVGNTLRGISMSNSSAITIGGPSLEDRNHIAANGSDGIFIDGSSNNVIKGNYIGLNANWTVRPNGGAGIKVLGSGAENNAIGAPGEGNTISGNGTRGIEMEGGTSNSGTIRGNNIGVSPDGLYDRGNALDGIYLGSAPVTVGGTGPGDGNIISGNNGHGIIAVSNGHVIQGNLIGVGSNFGGIGNGGDGIRLLSINGGVQIGGGDGPGGNVIAGNGGAGVYVYDGAILFGNVVRINTIFANGGLGIDLEYGNWPAPVIQQYLGGVLVGYVPGCAGCTVDVFQDTAGEGQYYVGTTTTNAGTAWSLSGVAHTLGQFTAIATTVTDPTFGANTSEFSAPFDAVMNSDGDAMPDATDPCPLAAEDYDAYFDGDGCPDADNDVDGICDPGQAAPGCTGSDTGKMCFDPAGTLPCATFDCRNIVEDYDGYKDGDGCPEPDNDNDGATDVVDQCPGLDWQAGPDAMFGSPQDLNHNGIRDGGEGVFTTDDAVISVVEDHDGVLDSDGCHDSPGEDYDGDGFTDDAEALKIGTNPGYPCGNPGWPADLLADNRLNVGDINSFLFPLRGNGSFNKFGHPVPDLQDPNIGRWNLDSAGPGAGTINIGDLNALNPAVSAPTARPPMFGGQPAFFANAGNGIGGCPLPP